MIDFQISSLRIINFHELNTLFKTSETNSYVFSCVICVVILYCRAQKMMFLTTTRIVQNIVGKPEELQLLKLQLVG